MLTDLAYHMIAIDFRISIFGFTFTDMRVLQTGVVILMPNLGPPVRFPLSGIV